MEQLRDGRYVVTRVLGEGGQASTFEAVDKREGRLVAIKRFSVRAAKQWKDVELAEREARVLASLSHPALPAYVEHFEENGALYLVMERIEGVSLTEFKRAKGVWREADVIALLEQASIVLQYLHTRTPPIVHRDLKPGNVIRRPDGSFAFVDFGAVRDRLKPEGGSTVVGTFGYMAPEQMQGRALPATDVYAIGATAMWMLTGREPEDLPHKGLAIDVAGALGARSNTALIAALQAMLEPDPEKRASSVAPLLIGVSPRDRSPRSKPMPPPPPPAPAQIPHAPWGEDTARTIFAQLRRFLWLFWTFAGFAWWLLPFRTALAFTIGLVVLTVLARRHEGRAPEPPPKIRVKRYVQAPSVRSRVAGDEVHAEEEPAAREERRRR